MPMSQSPHLTPRVTLPLARQHPGLRFLSLCFFLGLAPILAGCASAVVGAGAAVGVAAFEERPAKTILADTKIAAQVRVNLINAGEKFATGIGVEAFESRVLLTGNVANEKMRADALGLTWKVAGVTDVLNEIQISDAGFLNTAKDAWITTQLTSKITLDQDILAINYSVETVNGIVYLIGIAQSQAELDRVAAYARNISYVRKIISHVRVKTGTAKKS